jgi:hypothetical protein
MEYMFHAVESSFHTAECTFRPMEWKIYRKELCLCDVGADGGITCFYREYRLSDNNLMC